MSYSKNKRPSLQVTEECLQKFKHARHFNTYEDVCNNDSILELLRALNTLSLEEKGSRFISVELNKQKLKTFSNTSLVGERFSSNSAQRIMNLFVDSVSLDQVCI